MYIDKPLCRHSEIKQICKWYRDGNCALNIIDNKAPCEKEMSYLNGWIPCSLVDHPEHCNDCEVTRKDTVGYVRDIAFYALNKWRRLADETPVDVVAWKEPSEPYKE